MRFPVPGIRQVYRMTREHAMLLSFAGAAILFLTLTSFTTKRIAFKSDSGDTTDRNEAAIDAALQEAANSALADRDGTIIVMDARTGRVRAIVNPQLAYAQASMPGSTMKPFTALAALRAELIDESSRTVCPGRFTGLNFSLPCVHADHLPPFSPSQAIAYSCNYYFAAAGQQLDKTSWWQLYASSISVGRRGSRKKNSAASCVRVRSETARACTNPNPTWLTNRIASRGQPWAKAITSRSLRFNC